jgi:flagellin
MSLTVNSNLASLNAQNAISSNQQGLSTAMQRLSTGLKINSAADNAAGYSVSQRMTANINGTTQASSNANDAISMTQTAQGDLGSITANLQQIRTLAVQAANGSNSASDRAALNNQAQQLISEITRVASNSSFNGTNLLDGSFSATNFQVGANNNATSTIAISSIGSAKASSLGNTVNTVTSTAIAVGANTASGGLAAGDLTLNGIQVGNSVAGAKPGQTTGSSVQIAAAINAVSAQSGVTATANATTVTGAAATAFAAIPSTTTDLTINGVAVGNIAAGADAIGEGANVANAINLVADKSGVTATANASTGQVTLTAADGSDIAIGSGFTAANSGLTGTSETTATGAAATAFVAIAANTQGLTVNGVQVGAVAAGTDATSQGDNMAAAINLVSSQSGVTASNAAGVLTLTNTSKGAITMGSAFTGGLGLGIPTVVDAAGSSTTGTLSLASSSGGTITVSGNKVATAGLTAGVQTTKSQTNTLDKVDLSTSAGASAALSVLDGALNMVNTSSASLGAYQNRFTQTVSSLNSQNVNNTAARSRITDADFASETANLSRAQVLQQAGTAMLAQANQSAQGVLSLLR